MGNRFHLSKIVAGIMIALLTSSCAVVPTVGLHDVEYCRRIGDRIVCQEREYRIGTEPVYEGVCSIYDNDCVTKVE